MPIFEYRCPLGHVTEVIELKKVDTPSIVCSQCGSVAVKITSASSFGGFTEPKESNISRAIRKVKAKGL